MIETLTIIAGQTRRPTQRKAILRQANMVLRSSHTALPEKNDKEDVLQRYRLLLEVLNTFDDQEGSYETPDDL